MVLTIAAGVLAGLVGVNFALPKVVYRGLIGLQRKLAGLKTRQVTIDGHELVYLDGGRGDPLLLIHGFGADCDAWPLLAMHLNQRFRIVAPDLPGFGDSSRRPEASYSLDDQLARLEAFAAALGLDRFHLAGNSMGGYLAAHYAARHPEQVMSLWLLAPAGVSTAEESELQQMLARGENPLLVESEADFRRLLSMCVAKSQYVPGAVIKALAARAISDKAFHNKLFDELFASASPLEGVLEGLSVPTLIQWGDEDRLLHVSGAQVLHRLLPNSQLCLMHHTGHVPMREDPRGSARAFLDFQLKDWPAAASRAATASPTSRN